MAIEPRDDGLEIPEVGPWAKRKYHYLGRYLDAFTTSMKSKPWSGLFFIDLFCGAGFARIRGTDEIVEGSPILASNVRFPFTQLLLCDASRANTDACSRRLAQAPLPNPPIVFTGDSNQLVYKILEGIPPRGLGVAFIDPFNLGGITFETIRAISTRNCDLIILLPDHMDALRNASAYYEGNPESNLDRFLGNGSRWRELLGDGNASIRAQRLREMYSQQLSKMGYRHFDGIRVSNRSDTPLYYLLFASRHPAGLRLWQRVGLIDEGGQRELF